MTRFVLMLGTATLALATAAQAAPVNAPVAVGPTGPNTTFTPVGIDDAGRVAGTVTNTSAGTPVVTGYISGPNGAAGQTSGGGGLNLTFGGISSNGEIAGIIQGPVGSNATLLLSPANGPATTIDLTSTSATASGINASGVATGTIGTAGFVATFSVVTPFNAVAFGDTTSPVAINASGTITGSVVVAGTSEVFLRTPTGAITLQALGAGDAFATGINDGGAIVGNALLDASGTSDGFLLAGGVLTTLSDPDAVFGTFATGINDAGEVVGYYDDGTRTHGFVYQAGAYTTVDFCPTCSSELVGINSRGDVVGYVNAGAQAGTAFIAFAAPEPATVALGFGAAALLLRRRR